MKEMKKINKMRVLTRKELGETIFQHAKTELEKRGFSMWEENFDPLYPVSLRTLSNIRAGTFKVATLNSLPGVNVKEFFVFRDKSG